MIKLYKKEQLKVIKYKCFKEVIKNIEDILELMNYNYEEERNVDSDLGGYILIAENILDIEVLKQGILKNIMAEYTDLIECKDGVSYTSSLFLLSSDYSIIYNLS